MQTTLTANGYIRAQLGAYQKACQSLVDAYKAGEDTESIDWSDIDEAHRLALIALNNGVDSTNPNPQEETEQQ